MVAVFEVETATAVVVTLSLFRVEIGLLGFLFLGYEFGLDYGISMTYDFVGVFHFLN